MRKFAALVVITALATAACGQGGQPTTLGETACSVAFANGAPTPTAGLTCTTTTGLELVSINTVDCVDGSTLAYSLYGWGIEGKTWTYYDRHDMSTDVTGLDPVLAVCKPALYGGYLATPTAAASPGTVAPSVAPAMAALGSGYLQLAAVANQKLDTCSAGLSSSDLTTVKTAVATCIDADAAFTNGLAATNWGPAQPQVNDLISAIAKQKLVFGEMESASSIADMNAFTDALQTADGDVAGAVAVLRAALGLPQSS
jgi:hypothetical protein